MVTAEEIEELISKLHKEGKTIREISKIVHKNFSYVGAVLKKRFPEEYIVTTTITKETRALKLFSIGRTPTQVAIELNESPDLIEKYFADFWRLERMQSVHKLYLQNKNAIPNLLRLYEFLKKRGITPQVYNEVFDFIEKYMQTFREDDKASNYVEAHFEPYIYTPEELEEALIKAMNTNAKSIRKPVK